MNFGLAIIDVLLILLLLFGGFKYGDGRTPIHTAAENGWVEAIPILAKKYDVNAPRNVIDYLNLILPPLIGFCICIFRMGGLQFTLLQNMVMWKQSKCLHHREPMSILQAK